MAVDWAGEQQKEHDEPPSDETPDIDTLGRGYNIFRGNIKKCGAKALAEAIDTRLNRHHRLALSDQLGVVERTLNTRQLSALSSVMEACLCAWHTSDFEGSSRSEEVFVEFTYHVDAEKDILSELWTIIDNNGGAVDPEGVREEIGVQDGVGELGDIKHVLPKAALAADMGYNDGFGTLDDENLSGWR